jgi:glycosyltransferase involved in cell wall biosynthesis
VKPVVPVSAILPTRQRAPLLKRFLASLHGQSVLPAEIIVCDASDDDATAAVVNEAKTEWNDGRISWRYLRAVRVGLAPQRNQAVAAATQTYAWFLDDDVILDPACCEALHRTLDTYADVGGVTATITNQGYTAPGKFVRRLMRWLEHGHERPTYAGACIGPGYTFMPDTSPDIAPLSRVEWLIGCCSMYRKSLLPVPAVPDHFEQGALGEDLAASLSVGQRHRLLHVRDARCFHDSQGGSHKSSQHRIADQSLRNRWFIMTQVMGRDTPGDMLDFVVMHLFTLLSRLSRPSQWRFLLPNIAGYSQAVWKLLFTSFHV